MLLCLVAIAIFFPNSSYSMHEEETIWNNFKNTKNFVCLEPLLTEETITSTNAFYLKALWTHPKTPEEILNKILDLYEANNALLELPPRNLFSSANAFEIHIALRQYITPIELYVDAKNNDVKDGEYLVNFKKFLKKIKKSNYVEQYSACFENILVFENEENFNKALRKIANFFTIITKRKSNVEKDQLLNEYLSASFGEAATAFDGENGVSCAKGIWERIWGGLKVVDSTIADMLTPLEGVRLFKEWFSHPQRVFSLLKLHNKFKKFSSMRRFLNRRVLRLANKDYGLNRYEPYAINAAYPNLDSYAPLGKEVMDRLNTADYADYLTGKFKESFKAQEPKKKKFIRKKLQSNFFTHKAKVKRRIHEQKRAFQKRLRAIQGLQ